MSESYCEDCFEFPCRCVPDDCEHCGQDDCNGFCVGSDCGRDPETGMCGKAGSEECDFECPYRD